ncbi:Nucleotide-binding alpha-beta plait [Penicillium concentricum]|uniref:Nucleotide-binding alpha-beta plait n=1 Tax=Penicillium concentricum TaxID=293559 RepID=A0A9W9VIP4_9EURO|nr:Nucleotide-binding alpha-beta plait [Penicillium concentricum]KAJ5383678.1 Nucleotide-binding alpha-beta plait [Penicillium concentricum]
MSSISLIDSVIDDDDEFCPLCIEEFDLSDKNFKPCPCGYQICQFCYNNIKTQNEEGRCPNCRRGYDESTIQYKIPDVEEFKADLALKHRKAAAAKKKEAEKREIEASSRKNLAGVRVVQKNLVYVIGLNPTIRDENQLLQTLRGREYFGQYGEIEKIVVSKAKPGGNPNQGIGVYVTFSRKIDAAMCINAVDGSGNGDRVLRAQYGTTKYCSSFLRNEQCNNRNCTFLHETGEDSDSYSRQDLSSMNSISTQRPNLPPTPSHVRSAQPIAHPMRRQPSKDDSISSRTGIPDGPALPSTASWANKDVATAIHRTRRTSLTGSQTSNSPRPASVSVATPVEEPKRAEKPSPISQESQQSIPQVEPQSPAPQPRLRRAPQGPKLPSPFDTLLKDINSPDFKFSFSTAELTAEEVKLIKDYPSFIDPYGGVKRRAMREKVEQERLSREHELLQSVAAEEDSREAGSLQLGGEPEEANPPRNRQTRESHGAIQPPSQQDTADNSTVGSPVSATSHQFQGLNLAGRSLTPLQQQQLMLLKSAGNQQAGLADPLSSAALDQAAQARQGLVHNQMAQFNALQAAQSRQSSRFSFANEAASKNMPNARMLGQMQSSSPNPLSAPSPQHSLAASGFYASGVQGPPPGLKTAGTPPISGGGMFAQGHGFTSGLGGNSGKQDPTPELMRELLRGRTGTNVGGLQGQEAAKREFMFPFLQQHNTPPPMTPANGLLSSFYGPQAGVMPDSGGPQKQKKKGKKHRNANTSSGGGGVVDLADPSILQARMHQVGANATAGQALYGSQGQGGYNPSMVYGGGIINEDFPPLGDQSKDRRPVDSFGFLKSQLPGESAARAGTPTLPPGLPLPHAHPSSVFQERSSSNPSSPAPILPPGLTPNISRLNSPSQGRIDSPSRLLSPELTVGGPLTSSRVKDASQISFGSPVQKSATKARTQRKNEFNIGADFKDSPAKTANQSLPGSATTKASPLDFGTSLPLSIKTDQAPDPSSISAIGSRPDTPQTIASRLSDSPAPRQPRILRVVETPKTETPPIVTVPSVPASVAGGTKSRSRRQSMSSISIPDTPADMGWEGDYYPSTSASRANSPPASSRIGSAPVRSMTKSQVKKERKQKAKEAEAKKVEIAPVNEEPVQAPIMGRKRKTKKAPSATVSTADAPASSAPEKMSPVKPTNVSPVKVEPKVDTTKKVKAKETKPVREPTPPPPPPLEEPPVQKEPPVEPWRSNNTIGQLVKDSEALGRSIKDLFVERTKPLHELLAEMHKSGELDLNKSSLFNPSNLSQRTDMKCTAEDYDYLQCPNELTEEDRKTLLRGEPVRIGDDFLKTRCLITPRGCVLRHLEPEEEERYLELEKTMANTSDPFMIGDDASNPSGGLEALFANPEKFNICWVDDMPTRLGATSPSSSLEAAESVIPPNVLSAMEADSTRNHDWAVANSAEFLNTTPAAVRSFAAVTAQHMLGNPGMVGTNPTLDDVASLTNEELKDLSGRSQKDLELTRKEMDSLDKKFAALLRRNKKLQQQALNFAAGSEV